MGRSIDAITAVKLDVVGICRDLNVVAGAVIGMATRNLYAYPQAWNLFARLFGQEATGLLALSECHVHPVAPGATRTTERTTSGTMRRRWSKRPSRPWPMLHGGR